MIFYIFIFPFGITGNSNYLDLGILFSSKIKLNYNINIIFEIINENKPKKYAQALKINSYNRIYHITNFYKSSLLNDEQYIDSNGDFTINYKVLFNIENAFLYDIEDYYKVYINKNIKENILEQNIKKI